MAVHYRDTSTSEALFKTGLRGRGNRALYDLKFDVEILGYVIPKGFRTDRISQPWWAKLLMPRWVRDRIDWPAILHDFLRSRVTAMPTWKTDLMMLEAMFEVCVPPFWRNAVYLAIQTNNNRA